MADDRPIASFWRKRFYLSAKVNIDNSIRIGVVSAETDLRVNLNSSLSKVGLKNIIEFSSGRDVLRYLEHSSLNTLFVFSEIGDMHWSTFIRTLMTSAESYFTPVVFIFTKVMPEDKDKLSMFESYGIKTILKMPLDNEIIVRSLAVIQDNLTNSGSYEARMQQAKKVFKDGLFAVSARIFRGIIDEDQKNLPARVGLIQSSVSDPKIQVEQLNHIIAADPENYNFQMELMAYLLRQNKLGKFVQIFDDLMGEIRQQGEAYWLIQLGGICVSLKLMALIGKVEAEMAKKLPFHEMWRLNVLKAQSAMLRSDIEAAAQELKKLLDSPAKSMPEVLNIKSIIRKRQGALPAAVEAINEAIKASPDDYRLLYNLGLIYVEMDLLVEACQSFEAALRLRPDYERAVKQLEKVRKKS